MINSIGISYNFKTRPYSNNVNNKGFQKNDSVSFSGTFSKASCIPKIKGTKHSAFADCKLITQKVKNLLGWASDIKGAFKKLENEVGELKEGIANDDIENIDEEIGDILFFLCDIAEKKGINIEGSLNKANLKNITRIKIMEEISPRPLTQNSTEENNALWKQAKKIMKSKV